MSSGWLMIVQNQQRSVGVYPHRVSYHYMQDVIWRCIVDADRE